MIILLFFALHWYSSLFFQTFFHHRYSAHNMFTMSRTWEKIFFIGSWITQGSSYLSPYVYGILHRLHHAYADTEKDPHSPQYSDNIFQMMWQTKNVYNGILRNETPIEEKFMHSLPKWEKMDKIGDSWYSRIGWGVFYVAFYAAFVPAGMWYLWFLLPVHFVMGPAHGAVINWFAHKVGYTNFRVKDTSKNLAPVDILMLGEGFHNNHHKYSGRPNFGVKWFEFDPVYPVILVLNKLNIIKLNKRKVNTAVATEAPKSKSTKTRAAMPAE